MVRLHRSTKPISETTIERKWHFIDLKGKVLGRITNEIAIYLQGKHKTNYVSYLDGGDYVVAINSKNIKVTGKKADDKLYTYYSGYPGGLRTVPMSTLLKKKPNEVIRHAVMGKLPKNKLRDRRIARLYVYPEAAHPHQDKVVAK